MISPTLYFTLDVVGLRVSQACTFGDGTGSLLYILVLLIWSAFWGGPWMSFTHFRQAGVLERFERWCLVFGLIWLVWSGLVFPEAEAGLASCLGFV